MKQDTFLELKDKLFNYSLEYSYRIGRFARIYLFKQAVKYSTNDFDKSIVLASSRIHLLLSNKIEYGGTVNLKELVKAVYRNRQNIHDVRRFFYGKYGYCLFARIREEVSDEHYRMILKNI